jgi:hypothetical protein
MNVSQRTFRSARVEAKRPAVVKWSAHQGSFLRQFTGAIPNGWVEKRRKLRSEGDAFCARSALLRQAGLEAANRLRWAAETIMPSAAELATIVTMLYDFVENAGRSASTMALTICTEKRPARWRGRGLCETAQPICAGLNQATPLPFRYGPYNLSMLGMWFVSQPTTKSAVSPVTSVSPAWNFFCRSRQVATSLSCSALCAARAG